MTLAAIALALQVMVPPGQMVGPPTNTLPFDLVLCTGQGAVVISPGEALSNGPDHKAPSKRAHDSPCIFAGHGVGAPPPTWIDVGLAELVAYEHRPPVEIADMAPGRGLIGPPLPARGPPGFLI